MKLTDLPALDPEEMTDTERARIGLPPTRERVSRRTRDLAPHWFHTPRTCPRCKRRGNVGDDFGTITHRGVERAQSWCIKCRADAGKTYRKAPRKYFSKHNPRVT